MSAPDSASRYDLDAFRAQHRDMRRLHGRSLSQLYGVTDRLLRFLLQCLQLAEQRADEQLRTSFLFSFINLGSKVVSHVESIRTLVDIGRYGDATALTRVLVGDVTMITYLSIYPDDCAEWIELSQIREPRPTNRGRYGTLLRKFSEGRLRGAIAEAGTRPVSAEGYGVYSEAAHPSLWGMQFYADRIVHTANEYQVTYAAVYDPLVAIGRVAVMGALILDSIDGFIYWCEESKVGWHAELRDRWGPLKSEAMQALDRVLSAAADVSRELYRSPDTPSSQRGNDPTEQIS